MWIGTVRALPLKEQLRAAAIARCEAPMSCPPIMRAGWAATFPHASWSEGRRIGVETLHCLGRISSKPLQDAMFGVFGVMATCRNM